MLRPAARTLVAGATLGLVIAALAPAHVEATVVLDLSRRQLAEEAEVIAVGRCRATRSTWNPERTLISTYATYDVEDVVRGTVPGRQLVVKTLGGSVGNISQVVVDGPRFEAGDRNVLFLVDSDEPGVLRIFGLGRGQWRIATDPGSGDDVVVGAPAGPLPSPAGAGAPPALERRGRPATETEPLGTVLQELRRYVPAAARAR